MNGSMPVYQSQHNQAVHYSWGSPYSVDCVVSRFRADLFRLIEASANTDLTGRLKHTGPISLTYVAGYANFSFNFIASGG